MTTPTTEKHKIYDGYDDDGNRYEAQDPFTLAKAIQERDQTYRQPIWRGFGFEEK